MIIGGGLSCVIGFSMAKYVFKCRVQNSFWLSFAAGIVGFSSIYGMKLLKKWLLFILIYWKK
jgi:hypothetical protein